MRVGIIGSGYVGLVIGACFAHIGHRVICMDNNDQKVAMLRKGKSPIYEPGLEDLLRKNVKAGRLGFSTHIAEVVKKCQILFICVNTPPKDNGEADLSYVENVSREIARHLTSYRLVVEKSTVPVQTGEWIQKTIRENVKKKALFEVASNPEFLREGSAVHDLLHPDRVVIGVGSPKAERLLRALYKPLKTKMVVTDLKSAEIIKHASNSFLATKISFINAVARVCDAAGADVERVAEGMGLDPRIGLSFLRAGLGFGGFCFPKDLAAFYRISEKMGVPFHLLKSVLDLNDEQKKYYVQKVEKAVWNLKGKTLAVLGLAFKPDTDDTRYAPSIDIIKQLKAEGASIRAYDPAAMERFKEIDPDLFYAKDAYEACKGADALLLLTEWKEFAKLDLKKIKRLLQQPLLIDGRNVFRPDVVRKMGFQYQSIGRP